MLDKSKRYCIFVNSKNEEKDFITFCYHSEIYWVSKTFSPFANMLLEHRINELEVSNYTYPQILELYYNISDNKNNEYWIYYYVSSNEEKYKKLSIKQLIRNYKIQKLNENI